MASTLDHWHLRERPFEGVCDSRFFFESAGHYEALSRLRYLVEQESLMLGMLTGEIGCGKTMTVNRYASSIDDERIVTIVFENSFFSIQAIIAHVLRQFGVDEVDERADFSKLYWMLQEGLRRLRTTYDRHLLLLFDEAQDMSEETLSCVCRLTNLNGDGGRQISIVLVGQPELREAVSHLPSLDQRISLRFHLQRLEGEEVGDYLRHRLATAGASENNIFSPEATRILAEASRGIPREINRLAKLAMEDAASREALFIEAEDVLTVVRDLQRHQPQLKIPAIRLVS